MRSKSIAVTKVSGYAQEDREQDDGDGNLQRDWPTSFAVCVLALDPERQLISGWT